MPFAAAGQLDGRRRRITSAVTTATGTDTSGDFDPTAGVDMRGPAGNKDVFVTKMNANGTYAWTSTFGGPQGYILIGGVAAATDGSLYVTGTFSGTVDFDPGPATSSSTRKARGTPFIVKLASNGSLVWVRTLDPATDQDQASAVGIAVDSGGAVLVAGYYDGEIDLDPGPGMSMTDGGDSTWVIKLTSAGVLTWQRTLGANCRGFVEGFTVTADGSTWISGTNGGCPSSDGTPHESFVVSIGADGTIRTTLPLDYDGVIAVASDGSIYLGGAFEFTVDFDPGPGQAERVSFQNYDGYLVKLGSDGGFRWVTTFAGRYLSALQASPDGGVIVFEDDLPTVQDPTGFSVAKWTADGTSSWMLQLGEHDTEAIAIALDKVGFMVAGLAFGSVDFDPGAGIDLVPTNGTFLTRYAF